VEAEAEAGRRFACPPARVGSGTPPTPLASPPRAPALIASLGGCGLLDSARSGSGSGDEPSIATGSHTGSQYVSVPSVRAARGAGVRLLHSFTPLLASLWLNEATSNDMCTDACAPGRGSEALLVVVGSNLTRRGARFAGP
jgi:hypothetical protein